MGAWVKAHMFVLHVIMLTLFGLVFSCLSSGCSEVQVAITFAFWLFKCLTNAVCNDSFMACMSVTVSENYWLTISLEMIMLLISYMLIPSICHYNSRRFWLNLTNFCGFKFVNFCPFLEHFNQRNPCIIIWIGIT